MLIHRHITLGGVFLRDEEVGRIILQSGEVITKCGFCICSA